MTTKQPQNLKIMLCILLISTTQGLQASNFGLHASRMILGGTTTNTLDHGKITAEMQKEFEKLVKETNAYKTGHFKHFFEHPRTLLMLGKQVVAGILKKGVYQFGTKDFECLQVLSFLGKVSVHRRKSFKTKNGALKDCGFLMD